MESASLRRSDRVSLTLLLETSGKDAAGQEFVEACRTLLINRTGAVIVLERDLAPDQHIHLRTQFNIITRFGIARDEAHAPVFGNVDAAQ